LLLFETKFNEYAMVSQKIVSNSKAQDNYFHIKIGIKILTKIFTKLANDKEE
jgi:hypothetical protein